MRIYLLARQYILILSLTVVTSSCGTLFNWHGDVLKLESEPAGAKVNIDSNRATCVTPCELHLDPEDSYPFVASLEGYPDIESKVTRRPTGWFYVNAIGFVYGIAAAGVDWLTGRMWTWSRQKVIVFSEEGDDEGEEEEDEEKDEEKTPTADIVTTPPPKPLPPALKPDLPVAVQKKPEVDKPQLLPVDPNDARSLVNSEYIARRIEWIGGHQSPSELTRLTNCVYADLNSETDESSREKVKNRIDDSVRRALNGMIERCD